MFLILFMLGKLKIVHILKRNKELCKVCKLKIKRLRKLVVKSNIWEDKNR
jgi:hypothetical protein